MAAAAADNVQLLTALLNSLSLSGFEYRKFEGTVTQVRGRARHTRESSGRPTLLASVLLTFLN